MKKSRKFQLTAFKLIAALALFMSLPVFTLKVNAAPTAKAVCNKAARTVTFYYDEKNYGDEASGVFAIPEKMDGDNVYAPWKTYMDEKVSTEYGPITLCQISTVVFDKSFYAYEPTSLSNWFLHCDKLEKIEGLENLNTSKVTNMDSLFYSCQALSNIDLSHFDTSNVTSMSRMFFYCGRLSSLDLSSFDTSNVTNMEKMFYYCKNLKTISVSDTWNTNKVSAGVDMFTECKSLVGGAGTVFDDSMVNAVYARIDNATSGRGYLTEAPKYTVTFDLNGGGLQKDQPAAQTRYQFQKVSNPGIEGVLGWYTDAACSDSNKWNFDRDIVTEDMTLHAKWTPKPSHNFTDVNYERWMGSAINYVDAYGLMKGTTDTTFEPDTLCSRAMLVQILYNAEKSPSVDGWKNPFKDVPENRWYTKAVIWAVNVGATKGISDGQFGVENELTREQVAQFFYNYAALCNIDVSASADLSAFKDAGEISGWARDSMKWAKAVGLMAGSKDTDGNTILNPKGKATRAEVAQMIMNYMVNVLGR